MSTTSDDSLGSWKEMEGMYEMDEIISAVSQNSHASVKLLQEKENVENSLRSQKNTSDEIKSLTNVEMPDVDASSSKNDDETTGPETTFIICNNSDNITNFTDASCEVLVPVSEEEQQNHSEEVDDPTWYPPEDESNSEQETFPRDENSNQMDEDVILNKGVSEEKVESTIGKVKRTRRRVASKKEWHDNIQINLREQGKKYIGWSRPKNAKGKRGPTREGREMGPTCDRNFCKKSKYRQCQSISEESRTLIFTNFWEKMSWDQKKIYVVSLVKKVPSGKSTGEDSRRKFTMEYNLKSTDGNFYSVCKNMFLNTLGMKEWSVLHWVNTSDQVGMSFSTVNNIQSKPTRKTTIKGGKTLLEKFLCDLPKLPSHYCRQSSQKIYLEPMFGNTMADIYKAYINFCSEKGNVKPVSRFSFDQTIKQKRLAIQLPKKDKCDVCCMYEVKAVDEDTYNIHIQLKTEAREEKSRDKQEGEEGRFTVLTLDVQSVKVCPSLNASALYFKTKLCNHNFTIYNVNKKRALCYWFTEADADLSANTFTTCIIDYLSATCDFTKPIIIWSDGCGYQNRNCTLSNALLAFSVENQVEVYQKYLVKGHTQMEADSVHAAIERKLKNKPIYLPSDFLKYTVEATKEEKYEVKQLSFDFVKDYSDKSKLMYDSIRPGRRPGDPTVNDIKLIKYSPDGKIQVKINSFSSQFIDLPQRKKLHSVTALQEFRVLRNEPIEISRRKWLDLQELKNVIPFDCHAFYDNLKYEED